MMGWEAIEDDKNKKVLEVNGDEVSMLFIYIIRHSYRIIRG